MTKILPPANKFGCFDQPLEYKFMLYVYVVVSELNTFYWFFSPYVTLSSSHKMLSNQLICAYVLLNADKSFMVAAHLCDTIDYMFANCDTELKGGTAYA